MENNKIDILAKGKYLKKQLEETGWEDILYPWIESENFFSVMSNLINLSNAGKKFAPKLKYWFRPFIECPYDNVNTIFINIGPYNKPFDADGIPFSCKNNDGEHSLMTYIFDAIEESTGDCNRDIDLKAWANQGVLMLNLAMTVELNTTNNHFSLWKPFMESLLKQINENKSELTIILFGKKPQEVRVLLTKQQVIEVEHPSIATYKGKWKHDDLFIKVNKNLKKQNKTVINW